MTKPRQYFKVLGWGSIKRCAIDTGYNIEDMQVNGKPWKLHRFKKMSYNVCITWR